MRESAASGLPGIYERELLARGWQADAAQLAAVARLERLRVEFRAQRRRRGPGSVACGAASGRARATDRGRGVYLWGGVGRGKTWLMDLFFDSLGGGARRQHFHQLMRELHATLASDPPHEAPLEIVARRMARRAQLWCLDELQVNDIADAMLLGTLFEALLREGVTLVFTSNLPPSGLYRDGLQRARFLPAIALLEQRLDVLEVDAGTDYRLRQLRQAPI